MRYFLILFFLMFNEINAQSVVSDNGHPEHVIVGAIIGGGTSYLVYRKTNNKFTAWLIGVTTASALGYLKEMVDPKWFNGERSKKDFQYSVVGGVIGASIVIPLKRRKPRKTPNIDAAFKFQTLALKQLTNN